MITLADAHWASHEAYASAESEQPESNATSAVRPVVALNQPPEENRMIDAILELSLDLPARALDQCWNLTCRYVPLPPPWRDDSVVMNAQSYRRAIGRVDGVADEHRAWCADLSKPREQLAIPIPGASEAEVAAQEEDGSPLPIGRRVVQVAEASIAYASKARDLDGARR